MKKWKTGYLWVIIIIFILIRVPYFQYVAVGQAATIPFFGSTKDFTGIYPIMLFLGLIEWFLITVYVQSLINDIKKDEPKKFDL
jgi:hypothetical protein